MNITKQKRPLAIKRRELVTKQQVKSMLKSAEGKVTKKYLNTVILNGAPSTNWTLVQPTLPAQGTTNGEREADSLAIDNIEAHFILVNDANSTTTSPASDTIRIVCLQARANTTLTTSSAAAPTTGIFDLGASGSIDITSFINMNAKNELFHVLSDKSYSTNYLSQGASRFVAYNLKPKVSKVNFTPGTTTPQCGGIFWLFCSIQTSTVSLEQRLVYHDL